MNIMHHRTDDAATVQEPTPITAKESGEEDQHTTAEDTKKPHFSQRVYEMVAKDEPLLTKHQFVFMMLECTKYTNKYCRLVDVNEITETVKVYQQSFLSTLNAGKNPEELTMEMFLQDDNDDDAAAAAKESGAEDQPTTTSSSSSSSSSSAAAAAAPL